MTRTPQTNNAVMAPPAAIEYRGLVASANHPMSGAPNVVPPMKTKRYSPITLPRREPSTDICIVEVAEIIVVRFNAPMKGSVKAKSINVGMIAATMLRMPKKKAVLKTSCGPRTFSMRALMSEPDTAPKAINVPRSPNDPGPRWNTSEVIKAVFTWKFSPNSDMAPMTMIISLRSLRPLT